MRIVLDTNVLLVSISSKSRYRPIYEAFLNKDKSALLTKQQVKELISANAALIRQYGIVRKGFQRA